MTQATINSVILSVHLYLFIITIFTRYFKENGASIKETYDFAHQPSCACEILVFLPWSLIPPPGIYRLQTQRFSAEVCGDLKPDCDLHSFKAFAVSCHKNNTMLTQYYPVRQSQAILLSCPKTLTENLYENSFQML